MEWDVIIQAVSTVGFPIVAFGAMFWYNTKLNEVVRENTAVIISLKQLLEDEFRKEV